jgi:hypothetical protein
LKTKLEEQMEEKQKIRDEEKNRRFRKIKQKREEDAARD